MASPSEGDILLSELPPPAPLAIAPGSQGGVDSIANSQQGETFVDENALLTKLQQKTLHWLAYVLIVTSVLLVFQVVAGVCANSLALLADSAHSTLDVISFGLNYFVEKLKMRRSRGCFDIDPSKVDLVGSITSTFLLVVATYFAVREAVIRLGENLSAKEDDFDNIGEVLLAFSVISSMANILLVLYYFSRVLAPNAQTSAPVAPPPMLPVVMKDPSSASNPLLPDPPRIPSAQSETSLNPSMVSLDSAPASPMTPASVGSRRERRGKAGLPKLNLRGDYELAQNCSTECNPANCNHLTPLTANGGSDPSSTSKPSGRLSFSFLHAIVHPGCQDAAHGPGCCSGDDAGKQAKDNLNLTAAMLHLIADVVRGITILGCALLLQTGVIQDAGKADAVCALLVAAFILIGALAIFQRVAQSVCRPNS